jgi:hypothetical protein
MAKKPTTTIKSLSELAAARAELFTPEVRASYNVDEWNKAVDHVIEEILKEAGLDQAVIDEIKS